MRYCGGRRRKLVPVYNGRTRTWQLQWANPTRSGHKLEPPCEWNFPTKVKALERRKVIYTATAALLIKVVTFDTVDELLQEIASRKGHNFYSRWDPFNQLVGLRDETDDNTALVLRYEQVKKRYKKDLPKFWHDVGKALRENRCGCDPAQPHLQQKKRAL